MLNKSFVPAIAFFLISAFAAAQTTETPQTAGDKPRQEKIAQELGLNDTQKAAFFKLNDENRTKVQTLRNNTSLDDQAKKAEMQTIRRQYDSELKNIFTPEQYDQWTVMKKNAKENRSQGKGKGKGKTKGKTQSAEPAGTDGM